MSNETSDAATFESWAIVEIMGHRRFAGFVSEQQIGGASFVRIDVPKIEPAGEDKGAEPFTKLFGAASIYCITPCTETTARAFAMSQRAKAFAEFSIPRLEVRSNVYGDEDDELF